MSQCKSLLNLNVISGVKTLVPKDPSELKNLCNNLELDFSVESFYSKVNVEVTSLVPTFCHKKSILVKVNSSSPIKLFQNNYFSYSTKSVGDRYIFYYNIEIGNPNNYNKDCINKISIIIDQQGNPMNNEKISYQIITAPTFVTQ